MQVVPYLTEYDIKDAFNICGENVTPYKFIIADDATDKGVELSTHELRKFMQKEKTIYGVAKNVFCAVTKFDSLALDWIDDVKSNKGTVQLNGNYARSCDVFRYDDIYTLNMPLIWYQNKTIVRVGSSYYSIFYLLRVILSAFPDCLNKGMIKIAGLKGNDYIVYTIKVTPKFMPFYTKINIMRSK
jgi:hypothetical protein